MTGDWLVMWRGNPEALANLPATIVSYKSLEPSLTATTSTCYHESLIEDGHGLNATVSHLLYIHTLLKLLIKNNHTDAEAV